MARQSMRRKTVVTAAAPKKAKAVTLKAAYGGTIQPDREYNHDDMVIWANSILEYVNKKKECLFWEEWIEDNGVNLTRDTIIGATAKCEALGISLAISMDICTVRIAKSAIKGKLHAVFSSYVLKCQGFLRERPAILEVEETSKQTVNISYEEVTTEGA